MGTLSQAKSLGGIGSILVLFIVSLLAFPALGLVLAIIGFVMTLIAVKYISDSLQDNSIFKDMLIAVIVAIVGFVAVGETFAAGISRFAKLTNLTPSAIISTPGFRTFAAEFFVGLLFGWIILVVSAYFLRKAYNNVGLKLNVGMFRTAALIYFIGAILTVILFGLLLILIAQILLIIAFFSIPDTQMAYNPNMSPSPLGSPTMSTGTSMAGTKFCVKCGANIASDVNFCPNCGANQQPI